MRAIVGLILLVWAGFWTWFAVMHLFHDGLGCLRHVVTFVGPLVSAVLVAWLWPRVGGLILAAGGVFAGVFFANSFTRATLALPAIVFGVALSLLGKQRMRRPG